MLLDFFRINLLYIENLPTLSIRTPYKIHTMTVRNWITKLLKASNKVEQTFYVSERDKGDYNNMHVHMLIGTNTDLTYKEIKYGIGNVSVGDYQPIYDSETITVTKVFLGYL
ncbi:hypothetical protein N9R18_00935 [Flavobacteriaceae bacterium]|nr:hypothetical protein [Flavobacteriaceae bacterium]